MRAVAKILLVAFCWLNSCNAARILGIFPSAGYSQFILCKKLMGELVNRGHEVVVISPHQLKEPIKNFNVIHIHDLIQAIQDMDLYEQEKASSYYNLMDIYGLGNFITEHILAYKKVQDLLKSQEKFDLVIVEHFFNEAHLAFAQHFKAPLVTFGSVGVSHWTTHLMGNIYLPSVNAMTFTRYTNHMTLWERCHNTLLYLFDQVYKHFIFYKHQQELIDKYFPEKISLDEVLYKSQLLLTNSHPAISEPAVLTPSTIEVGGFYIEPQAIPKEIEDFLDGATEGAVLFSMGTNLNSSKLSTERLNNILNVFKGLKQRVLWKFEEELENKPDNLLIRKWMPQSGILAHPNTVAFITHGGLLSTTESVFHGVPIIGVGVFGDQKINVARAQKLGFGVEVAFANLGINSEGKSALKDALEQVLNNPRYRNKAKELSKIVNNQPVKPLDLAMFWIEHVLHYKNASHLHSATLDLPWYQLYLLDVLAMFCSTIFILLLTCCYLFKK